MHGQRGTLPGAVGAEVVVVPRADRAEARQLAFLFHPPQEPRRAAAEDGRKHLAPVVRFKDEPSEPLYREPLLGEHTAEILARRG